MKIFLMILLLLSFISCDSERVKPAINKDLNVRELPAQESWNSRVFFTDSGKTRAILNAGHIRVFRESRETLLDKNIRVDFFNQQEVKTTTLTAKRGKVDDRTNDLYAIDSVVAVNDSGIVITTEEMKWRNRDRKIISDKFVTILTPKEKIQGYGFESDQNLRNYVIYNITYITRRDSL
ncbi:MAG: LPS export ABC transporter periplasmic protein LptC [Ignavibacteriaceae bacterium]|nr:LPS export ABC transporter periplasmic protein LptC [Ignavibacteriaceae bacterium]